MNTANIIAALTPLFLAVLAWVAKKLADLINAKVQNESLRGILVRLDGAVATAVAETAQVTVDAWKKAAADGKLTKEQAEQAKQAALASLKSYLGAKGLEELAKVLGWTAAETDRVLDAKVEAAVFHLRQPTNRIAQVSVAA